MSEFRTIALQSGEDCYDCSCDHLDVPIGMDLEDEKRLWSEAGRYHKTGLHFEGWLKSRGAADSQMECIDDN